MPSLEQQKRLFETFGYIVLPGQLKSDIEWITDEFEAVFRDRGVQHDESQRSTVVPFIDQRERLCTLLDHPSILPIVQNLLGDDFNYVGGDGNYYSGDTTWHSDGYHTVGMFLKAALYLDPVARDSGCLRVIPGSHRRHLSDWNVDAAHAPELWGIEGRDVPCVPLESQPGDLVIFNHNLMHSAFGGGTRRRMFTLNLCRHCDSPDEIDDLKTYIAAGARFWVDSTYGDTIVQTASPERRQHLAQVLENEGHLPGLSAEARLRMKEPARG